MKHDVFCRLNYFSTFRTDVLDKSLIQIKNMNEKKTSNTFSYQTRIHTEISRTEKARGDCVKAFDTVDPSPRRCCVNTPFERSVFYSKTWFFTLFICLLFELTVYKYITNRF